MPDDWDWFWAGEGGRDNILRTEVEGAFREASQARSQAARLSSQLAQVQGSMETRLGALAAAFDAYVELGDVREQLAGHPDTSAVRRDAVAALEVLTRGGVPRRLTDETGEYWLADAMNAVIARATGAPDLEAESRATALDRDAELFVVAAAGALGHGAPVGDRVPPLLITDGELSPAQQALWAAVLAGAYGDVLPAVREPWTPALHRPDADWRGWARTEARTSTPLETLRWIQGQIVAATPGAAAAPVEAPQSTARTALGAVALALVQRGLGEEVALLERARELRAKIERPQDAPDLRRATPATGKTSDPPATVLTAVRTAFLAATPGSPRRTELLTWVRPGLVAVVDECLAEVEASRPETVEARTPGGVVAIEPAGVTGEQRQKVETRIAERHLPVSAAGRLTPGVVAGVLAVATLVVGALGRTDLAVLAGLAAAVALGFSARGYWRERRRREDLQRDLELARRSLAETADRAQRVEAARLDVAAEARRLAAGLRDRLSAAVG